MTDGNFAVAQSGGPTAAINATLLGVIRSAQSHNKKIYGAVNGIKGVLEANLIELCGIFSDDESKKLLKNTPGAYLGSCRVKLPDASKNAEVYENIFAVFEKYNITQFIYIGGNDSMDTVNKLSEYAEKFHKNVFIVGAPKTIDNDLAGTDHCPGFGSAAKLVAASVKEIARDSGVYAEKSITIIEIMGRNAGWLTAASALARCEESSAPHLIYLPEIPVSRTKIINDVKGCSATNIIIALSEGLKDETGSYYCDAECNSSHDIFGHARLAGCAKVIENLLSVEFGYKMRSVELNVLQRCSGHFASLTDLNESEKIGLHAAEAAYSGRRGIVMGFKRTEEYRCEIIENKACEIANRERTVPMSFISDKKNDVTDAFITYCRPLILGNPQILTEDGLPKHITR